MQEHSASLDLAAGRAAQAPDLADLTHREQPQPEPQARGLTSESDAADAADESDSTRRPFTVRDRRFWARDPGDGSDRDGDGRASKPTYVRELEDKLAQAEAKTAATLAQYQAARAEFEAARARMRRDLSREVEAGKRGFLVELLDVVDNLDRAVAAAGPANEARADSLLEGVTMVQRLFIAKLAQLGVRAMSCLGAPFDAQRHEALATTPVGEPGQDGRVSGVVREGYLLNDSTLRFAQVAVGRLAATAADAAQP